jgi:hypothetical protein
MPWISGVPPAGVSALLMVLCTCAVVAVPTPAAPRARSQADPSAFSGSQSFQEPPSPSKDAALPSPGAGPKRQPLDLEEAVAHDVFEPFQSGIETENLKQVTGVFDPDSSNLPQIQDSFRALFLNYSLLRFRYKFLQLRANEHSASAICEIDLDATPADADQLPLRRSTQMRFQLTQTAKGWKIAAFTPADFFAQ